MWHTLRQFELRWIILFLNSLGIVLVSPSSSWLNAKQPNFPTTYFIAKNCCKWFPSKKASTKINFIDKLNPKFPHTHQQRPCALLVNILSFIFLCNYFLYSFWIVAYLYFYFVFSFGVLKNQMVLRANFVSALGITFVELWELPYGVLGIKPDSAAYKANALTVVLSLYMSEMIK